MQNAKMDKLAWILLYGGSLLAVLGGFMRGAAPTAGWVLVGFGSLAALVGVLMIWLRSRRPD